MVTRTAAPSGNGLSEAELLLCTRICKFSFSTIYADLSPVKTSTECSEETGTVVTGTAPSSSIAVADDRSSRSKRQRKHTVALDGDRTADATTGETAKLHVRFILHVLNSVHSALTRW